MNQNTSWALGAIAIVLAALVARGAAPQPASEPAKAPEAGKESKDKSEDDKDTKVPIDFCPARCLYQEFFGISPGFKAESWQNAAANIRKSASDREYTLEFLIALVPDPVDSHSSNLFDESLEGLQRGIADSGYLFDRVSLPWKGKAAEVRLYRWIPGGMLFRRVDDNGHGRLLGVLLVGESPKSGIQKQAFYEALDFITGLQPAEDSELRILGPSFSGSADSLQLALQQWGQGKPATHKVRLVTGSATSPSLPAKFAPKQLPARLEVEFERTVLDNDSLQTQALNFLRGHLGWSKDVALVTEFDTSYGSSGNWNDWLTVPFPSNLAHIRTSREKLGLDRDRNQDAAEPIPSRKSLDLSLVDKGDPIDVVPQFSDLSTQANDLALARLLRRVHSKRYIGILATDIQDRLFLAKQIRSFCPDAVLFTFDNHLLDAHPEVAQALDGTLVLTNFPLYPPEERVLHQFTSEFQEGIYRAALQLIEQKTLEPPSVWISAVGNGVVWPVAALTLPKETWKAGNAIVRWLVAAVVIVLLALWIRATARPLREAQEMPRRKPEWAWGATFLPAMGLSLPWLASGSMLVFFTLPVWWCGVPRPGTRNFWTTTVLLTLAYLWTTRAFARMVSPLRRWGEAYAWVGIGALVPIALGLLMRLFWLSPGGAAFFYIRAGDFSSGLSPLVSLALFGAAVYAWALLELKRRLLVVSQDLPWPLPNSQEPALAACAGISSKVREVLLERSPRKEVWVILACIFVLPAPRLLEAIQPIAERRAYGVVFLLAVACVLVLSALSFYRFFAAWTGLERILNRLCDTWMLPVFRQLSETLDWKPLKSFGLRMPSIKMTLVSAQQLRRIFSLGLSESETGVEDLRESLDEDLKKLFAAESEKDFTREVETRIDLREWFDDEAGRLESLRRDSGSADLLPKSEKGEAVPRPREIEMREIEAYLAIRVVAHLRYIFAHLRYALVSATLCGLTLLVAVSSYAFQPKQFLSFGIWLLLLLASAMTLRALMQMDRNGVLSAISGTDAGKISLDRTFLSNLLTYGALPVMGIIVTQLPSVGQLFSGWLGPLLRIADAH